MGEEPLEREGGSIFNVLYLLTGCGTLTELWDDEVCLNEDEQIIVTWARIDNNCEWSEHNANLQSESLASSLMYPYHFSHFRLALFYPFSLFNNLVQ